MLTAIPAAPKLVIFGSPNSLLQRPRETIWKTVFDAAGENVSYDGLRRQFKRGQLTPFWWARRSGERLVKAGLDRETYAGAASPTGLLKGAEQFIGSIEAFGGITAIVSGGFSDLCIETAARTGIQQVISQATPIFDKEGKLIDVLVLSCDYQGKVGFTNAIAGSMGFSPEECVLIAEGEGDIPLAHVMPSVAFNAPRTVEMACNIAVRSKDLSELLNLFTTEAATKRLQKDDEIKERIIPHTVLLGNQKSDAVLIDFEGKPAKYEGLLDKFAAIGPLITDKPGVELLMQNIAGTGIRLIYVTGKPSVFKPDIALREAAGKLPQFRVKTLEEVIDFTERKNGARFMHRALGERKVFQAPFVPDIFSFVVYEFSGQALAEVYRDRTKIDAVTGSSRAVLEGIVARYGNRVSASNVTWLAQQLLTKAEDSINAINTLEFEKLQDAYIPVIMRTWLNGRKYLDERGEEATELNPLIVRIKNVTGSTIPKSDALDKAQMQRYVRQFVGEEDASMFDYSTWDRIKGQIDDVVKMLGTHPETRRAHLLVARGDDVKNSMAGVEQPCHFALDFTVREGKLDIYALMRSNDVVRAFPADALAAMRLQQRMAEQLGLGVGAYTHLATRAQIYSRDYGFVQDILQG